MIRFFTRWMIVGKNANNELVYPPSLHSTSTTVELDANTYLVEAHFDPAGWNSYAGDTADYTMLPSLQAPAEKMQQKHLDFFAARSITPSTGDTTINLLRKLRDANGVKLNIDADT